MKASKVVRNFRVKTVPARVSAVVSASSIETFSRSILRTPVDLGRARGNWGLTVSAGQIDKTGAVTIDRVTREVIDSDYRAGFSLVNALPYIERLEYGYSGQAPQGMVRITAQEFPAIVAQIANS